MPAPRVLRLLVRPLEIFFRTEALGGTVLILATVAALVWANSPLAETYRALWGAEVTIGTRGFGLSKPLILWVNDLLMAVFFLVVGLEIKRELLVGELNSVRKAMLPVLAAVGGMVAPAVVFLAIASDAPASRGWGVPMATDIAFALGCLRLLGSRVPPALIVYLTALAIMDDLGAILVIALFYSSGLSLPALGVAGAVIAVLVGMNRLGVRRAALYVLVGIPLWIAILKSGIHATIAGVVVGLCVPARALFSKKDVVEQARELLEYAEKESGEESEAAMRSLEHRLDECESPLSRLEHALHPWVAFAIVPVFALANAGVSFVGVGASDLGQPAALGIMLGLFLGKQVGVFGATYAAVRLGAAVLPGGVTWRQIYGASLLAGIGFTMSLFIAGLAYGEGTPQHVEAKLGILCASLVCALFGLVVIGLGRRATSAQERPEAGQAAPPAA
jgi:NhaA family Na+:H+ antiporter